MAEFVKNIEDPKYYFDLACAEHARINLFFTLDMCHISNIRAICVMVKNGHFVVSAPIQEVERSPIVWGTEADGYFAVRDVDLVHCHFKSRVVRIYNGPQDSIFLVFPLPGSIDHKQRRFSLRMPMDKEKGDKFQVWHGWVEEKEDKLPTLRWNSLQAPLCSLGDISSTGLRLDISEKHPLADGIDINDAILLRGDFGQKDKALPLSVLARVRRKMVGQKDSELVSIGCQFMKWRKIQGSHNQAWFKSETDMGIPVIAQWISRNFRGRQS